MKKVLLLGVLVSLIFAANAQVIPNAGFENWDSNAMYENPTGFSTSNTYIYPQTGEFNVMKQSPAYSGSYSARLVTMDLMGYPFPGFMVYGDPSAIMGGGSLQSLKGGFPYSQMPDSFIFYSKYNCVHGDTGYVLVLLKKFYGGTSIPISLNIYKLIGSHPDTFKRYSYPVTKPPLPVSPDSAIIGFSSSNPLNQDSITTDNWLEIDKISFKKNIGTAAAIPNNDFESWDEIAGVEPQGWATINFIDLLIGQPQSVVPVTPGHSGKVAAKITSNVYDVDTLGFLVLGDVNSDNPGMGIIDNPDSLSFWYKYNNANNTKDNAYAVILFTKFNSATHQSDQLDSSGFALNATSAFTYKTLKFPNIYGKSPDSIGIYFSSSKFTPTGRGVGNYLIVDDVLLWSHHVGIAVGSTDPNNAFVYPNPANNFVNVQFELNTPMDVTISLVDLNGRKVKSQDFSLTNGKQQVKIDLQEVNEGQYLVVIAQGNNSVYSKRIVVKR
jgi:hypothetical protein